MTYEEIYFLLNAELDAIKQIVMADDSDAIDDAIRRLDRLEAVVDDAISSMPGATGIVGGKGSGSATSGVGAVAVPSTRPE